MSCHVAARCPIATQLQGLGSGFLWAWGVGLKDCPALGQEHKGGASRKKREQRRETNIQYQLLSICSILGCTCQLSILLYFAIQPTSALAPISSAEGWTQPSNDPGPLCQGQQCWDRTLAASLSKVGLPRCPSCRMVIRPAAWRAVGGRSMDGMGVAAYGDGHRIGDKR